MFEHDGMQILWIDACALRGKGKCTIQLTGAVGKGIVEHVGLEDLSGEVSHHLLANGMRV